MLVQLMLTLAKTEITALAFQQVRTGSNRLAWILLIMLFIVLFVVWWSRDEEVGEETGNLYDPLAYNPTDLARAEEEGEQHSTAYMAAHVAAEHAAPAANMTAPVASELDEVTYAAAEADELIQGEEIIAAPPAIPDDLKKLEGIGPRIEQLLHEAGITTFAQLSQTSVNQINDILTGKVRLFFPETWAEQAALAAAGRWDELSTMQNQLRHGRRHD